jgi:DNA polymerase III epsilon subunit-like protein
MVKVIVLDTETTGLPKSRKSPLETPDGWPDIVSFSWSVFLDGVKQSQQHYVIRPEHWIIPDESTQIHGITHAYASTYGVPLQRAMDAFKADLHDGTMDGDTTSHSPVRVVAHNLTFDRNVLFHAWKWRLHEDPVDLWKCKEICTMRKSEHELRLVQANGPSGAFKWPSLAELWVDTFKTDPPKHAHCAERDVRTLEKICLSRWKDAIFMV